MQHIVPLFQNHILLVAFLNLFLSQAGLPVPVMPTLLAGSALLGHTTQLGALIFLAVTGAVLGDCVLYLCGRRYGQRVLGRLCLLTLSPDFCVRRAQTLFTTFGGWLLLFAKFIPGASPVAVTTTGIAEMAIPKFLLFATAGKLFYVTFFVAIGLLFRNEVTTILATFAELGQLGGALLIAALALYVLGKWWRRRLLIRQLRMDRITVQELRSLIDGGRRVLVFDVRPKDVRDASGIIPNALPAHSTDGGSVFAKSGPQDEIVIYCDCPNEASAAKAAKHLKQEGYRKIRPLLGGFDAWVRAGYPLQRADFDAEGTSPNSESAIAAPIAAVSEPRRARSG
jgi:membrane protein DedA with SNARE-associated domain/rhodanese-related sulfurtransferase